MLLPERATRWREGPVPLVGRAYGAGRAQSGARGRDAAFVLSHAPLSVLRCRQLDNEGRGAGYAALRCCLSLSLGLRPSPSLICVDARAVENLRCAEGAIQAGDRGPVGFPR